MEELCKEEKKIVENRNRETQNFNVISTDLTNTLHEFHGLQSQTEGKKIKRFEILLMTTSKAAMINNKLRYYLKPSVVIIDEAAQEFSGIVLPTTRIESAKLVFISGDPHQLPPRSQSGKDHDALYGSIMKTLNGVENTVTLLTQYRMVPALSTVIRCSQPYERLIDGQEPLHRIDSDPSVLNMTNPFIFFHCEGRELRRSISTVGDRMIPRLQTYLSTMDEDNAAGSSWSNATEVECIKKYVVQAVACKLSLSKITIIAPYNSQVNLLKNMLDNYLKPIPSEELSLEQIESNAHLYLDDITTPEKFQGKENTIVLVSLVRNNRDGNIGFLNVEERLNVFLSRARNRLILFGNFPTFEQYVRTLPPATMSTMFWVKLMGYMNEGRAILDFNAIYGEHAIEVATATEPAMATGTNDLEEGLAELEDLLAATGNLTLQATGMGATVIGDDDDDNDDDDTDDNGKEVGAKWKKY
jgi:hypothetical protein